MDDAFGVRRIKRISYLGSDLDDAIDGELAVG